MESQQLLSALNTACAPGRSLRKKEHSGRRVRGTMQKGLLSKQIATVDKADLIEKIGSLSRVKIMEVIDGVKLLIEPREVY